MDRDACESEAEECVHRNINDLQEMREKKERKKTREKKRERE